MEELSKIMQFINGYGDGSGYGYIKINKLNNDIVFYIDDTPTIIDKNCKYIF